MIEGLIALFFANFIGGALSPLFVKLGIGEFPPVTFTLFRFIIAALALTPFVFLRKTSFDKKHTKQLIFYSLFFSGNVIFYAIGLQFTTAIATQILYATVPILTGILSFFIVHERFGPNKIFGAVLSMIGVGILMYGSLDKSNQVSLGTPFGNFIIMVGILSWTLYLVFSKKLTSVYSPKVTTFASFLVTIVVTAAIIPFEWAIRPFVPSLVTPVGIVSLFGVSVVSSTISYFLIQFGIKRTTPFTASIFFYLAPLFSSLTAVPILHEKITTTLVIGGILIISGVFLATTYEFLKKR